MLDPGSLFNILLAALVVVVAALIVRAVRLTSASLEDASRHVDLTQPDAASDLARTIRALEVPCPGCGGAASTVLGARGRYRCDSCRSEFDGPDVFNPLTPGGRRGPEPSPSGGSV